MGQGGDPGVAYFYAPDRERPSRPITHLAGFAGVLQVDGYGGYRVLADKGGATLPSVGYISADAFVSSPLRVWR
jgi:hypothetical protein